MNHIMLKFNILIVCFTISFVAFGQDSISKIEQPQLKSIIEKGYIESMNLLKRTLPNTTENDFEFFNNYSFIETEDERGYSVPTFPINMLNAEKVDLERLRRIRYDFVYKYSNNIGLFFIISYDLQKGPSFFEKKTETNLRIIDSLKNGYCEQCIFNLNQYIRDNKIKDYQVQVKSFGKSGKFEKAFVWAVIIIDKESINNDSPFLSGGEVVFIDPSTGKNADMSKFFAPPTISE